MLPAQDGKSPMELKMAPALKQALAVSVCCVCAVCSVGITLSLISFRGLLCFHQDAYEAYCCCGIGLK